MSKTYFLCTNCGASVDCARSSCQECGTRVEGGHRKRKRRPLQVKRLLLVLAVLVGLSGAGFVAVKFLAKDPARAQADRRLRAAKLTHQGEFQSAALLWRKVIEVDPKDGAARRDLAYCLLSTGKSGEGVRILEELVATTPRDANAWALLSRCRQQQGDRGAAVEAARAALEITQDAPLAHLVLGAAALEMGLTQTARKHLTRAREADPKNIDLQLDVISLSPSPSTTGKAALANVRRAVEEELRANPDSLTAKFRLIRVMQLEGDRSRALGVALRLLERDPKSQQALAAVARLLPPDSDARLGKLLDDAIAAGADPSVRLLLAEHRMRQRDYGAALRIVEEGLTRASDLRILLLRRLGRSEEALQELMALPADERSRPDVEARRILLLADLGDLDSAMGALGSMREVIGRRPDLAYALVDGLLTALEERRPSKSREWFEELSAILGRAPNDEADTQALRSRVFLDLGQGGLADSALSRAEDLAPDSIRVKTARILHDLVTGHLERAVDHLTALPQGDSRAGWTIAARLALASRRPRIVLRLAEHPDAPADRPDWVRMRVLALLQEDKSEEAWKLLKGSSETGHGILRCRILRALGRKDDAEKLALELENGPQWAQARGARVWWRAREGMDEQASALLFDPKLPPGIARRSLLYLATLAEAAARRQVARIWLARGRARWKDDPEILARLATLLLRRGTGNPEAAQLRTTVAESLAANASCLPLRISEGYYRMMEGDLDFARAEGEAALRRDPSRIDARHLLALVEARSGNLDAARLHLRVIFEHRPEDEAARSLLAGLDALSSLSLLRQGDPDAASELLSAHEGEPDSPAILRARLQLLLRSGDLVKATETLRALGLDKDAKFLTRAHELEAVLADGDPKRAVPLLREMATLRPESPLVHLRLGLILLGRGEVDAGIEELREAHSRAPRWSVPLAALCRALTSADRAGEALSILTERLDRDSGDGVALALTSEIQLGQGDLPGAVAFARRAVEHGGAGIARDVLIRATAMKDGAEAAWRLAESWAGQTKPPPRAHSLAGRAALAAGEMDAAETHLKAALETDGEDPEILASLAELHLLAGRRVEARRLATRAAAQQPMDAALQCLLAGLLQAEGELKEAEAAWERALSLRPDHPLAALNLAQLLLAERRDLRRAKTLSDAALSGYPDEPEPLDLRGRVLLADGDAEGAARYLGMAVEAGGGPATKARHALALAEAGQAEVARKLAETILLESGPELPSGIREQLSGLAK